MRKDLDRLDRAVPVARLDANLVGRRSPSNDGLRGRTTLKEGLGERGRELCRRSCSTRASGSRAPERPSREVAARSRRPTGPSGECSRAGSPTRRGGRRHPTSRGPRRERGPRPSEGLVAAPVGAGDWLIAGRLAPLSEPGRLDHRDRRLEDGAAARRTTREIGESAAGGGGEIHDGPDAAGAGNRLKASNAAAASGNRRKGARSTHCSTTRRSRSGADRRRRAGGPARRPGAADRARLHGAPRPSARSTSLRSRSSADPSGARTPPARTTRHRPAARWASRSSAPAPSRRGYRGWPRSTRWRPRAPSRFRSRGA